MISWIASMKFRLSNYITVRCVCLIDICPLPKAQWETLWHIYIAINIGILRLNLKVLSDSWSSFCFSMEEIFPRLCSVQCHSRDNWIKKQYYNSVYPFIYWLIIVPKLINCFNINMIKIIKKHHRLFCFKAELCVGTKKKSVQCASLLIFFFWW